MQSCGKYAILLLVTDIHNHTGDGNNEWRNQKEDRAMQDQKTSDWNFKAE